MGAILFPVLAILGLVIGVVWIFGLAVADTVAPKRNAPANTPIADFYLPKWGAYHRRKVGEVKADWEEDFRRALK